MGLVLPRPMQLFLTRPESRRLFSLRTCRVDAEFREVECKAFRLHLAAERRRPCPKHVNGVISRPRRHLSGEWRTSDRGASKSMPLFSFEVLRPDGSNVVADERDLPSNAEIWGHLEVLAIQLRRHRDLQLRVKDLDGSIVVLSGIDIAIATIERCRRTTCPIKELLASGARICACAPCMSIPVSEIPWLDLPDMLSISSAIAN